MRLAAAIVTAVLLTVGSPVGAATGTGAIESAEAAFAKVDDYRMTIAVHEVAGDRVEDGTYTVMFKKPSLERIDVVAGRDKGGGIVWLGGDKVKGHRGGLLSGIHLTFDLHNSKVSTLRGDSVDSATIPAMLADFAPGKGTISEAPGPAIDGAASLAVTLNVTEPATQKGVTRIVLYLSDTTHLPVRREKYVGTGLVKSENVTDTKINVGLTQNDFPW